MEIINRRNLKHAVAALLLAALAVPASAQVMRKDARKDKKDDAAPGVTFRMKEFYEPQPESDANLMWMRVIYRQIDLTKAENMPLYYPEEPTEDQQSLFRIILGLVTSGQVPAYEYLDGREMFTDQYKVKVRDMLDRFHIIYTEAKGSTEKNPKFAIDESDVPSNEVLSYYIVERWTFDTNENKTRKTVEAICPVLHRTDDFGGEPVKYPMFWIKFDVLRPYLAQQSIFLSDDNNLEKYNYDDFFQLGLYKGDIYKTRNLRNQSLMQMFPDPEDLKHAQDSIENRLESYDKHLWVPSREELEAKAEAEEAARLKAEGRSEDVEVKERDEAVDDEANNKRSVRKTARSRKAEKKKNKPKAKNSSIGKSSSSSSSGAVRSVRRRR